MNPAEVHHYVDRCNELRTRGLSEPLVEDLKIARSVPLLEQAESLSFEQITALNSLNPLTPAGVEIEVDTRRLDAALRRLQRSMDQGERNSRTRPLSAERRAVQRMGRAQLDASILWLRLHVMEVRTSAGLPNCGAVTQPGGALAPRTFTCGLEPDHQEDHLCKEGLSWPT